MTPEILFSLIAYPFFWLHSFDPHLRTRIFFEGSDKEEMTFALIPGWISPTAIGYTAILGAVAYYDANHCSLHPDNPFSFEGFLAIVTVMMAGKIVFGPSSSAFTSFQLGSDWKARRPISLRAYDFVTAWPVTALSTIVTKVIWFSIFGVMFWGLARFGIFEGDSTISILPLPIVCAWFLLTLARLSGVFVNSDRMVASFYQEREETLRILGPEWVTQFERTVIANLRWEVVQKLVLFAVIFVATFATYALLEKALRSCGAGPNSGLPSTLTLIAGLGLVPALEFLLVVFFDAMSPQGPIGR